MPQKMHSPGTDEKYMHRCLQIAKNGLGTTAPNPMVGAVIVCENKIIGEGYTSVYGGAHAEVNAINSVKYKSLLPKSTLYVTLEPCSHFGKTPPCADLILKHQIPTVVVGILDPNEQVAGRGIEKLKANGCIVVTGILAEACRKHHKRFLRFHEKKRPYLILKWAETQDGFIAPLKEKRTDNPAPVWISNERSRQLTHQWRSEEQAILIGTNTVLQDNPKLNVRHWTGTDPIRIIIDRDTRLQGNLHVLDKSIPTMLFTSEKNHQKPVDGIDIYRIDFSKEIIPQLCAVAHTQNVNSILIEGGAKTIQTFIDSGFWDEARVFVGASFFQDGMKAPTFNGDLQSTIKVGSDTLNTYYND